MHYEIHGQRWDGGEFSLVTGVVVTHFKHFGDAAQQVLNLRDKSPMMKYRIIKYSSPVQVCEFTRRGRCGGDRSDG